MEIRYPRPSNYERNPTGRTPTRRIRTGGIPPGRIPTKRIRTIGPQPKRRLWPFIVLMILELLFLVGMVALWLWPYLASSNYVGLNDVMVAHVQISTTRIPHLMYAQVTIFNQDQQPSKPIECYITQGNKLLLQGDIITFAPWENSIGLHSGFKLTRLMGCHGGATLTDKDSIADLNGGEDGFFAMVQGKAWDSQLIQAQAYYSQPITFLANLPVGQKTQAFNVFTSPKGLYKVPSK